MKNNIWKKAKDIFKDKRCNIISLIIAIILSLFQVIGHSIDNYMSLEGILKDKTTLVNSISSFFGYTLVLFFILVLLYKIIFPKILRKDEKNYKFFTNNKRSFILVAIFIFIMYIPYFLSEFPGIISPLAIEYRYRYIYSLFTCFPIIGISTIEFANKKEISSEEGEQL